MSYLYLLLAIAGELLGTTLMKASDGFSKLGLAAGSILSFILCFVFLSQALKGIPMNIAYATWSGLGLVITTAIAVAFFKESINAYTILGLVLIVVGVLILNLLGGVEH